MDLDRSVIPANTISGLLDGFDAVGLDTTVMLRHLGVARERFQEPYATVPRVWLAELYELAFLQDPRLDLPARVGRSTPFGAFGLVDYLVGSAETLGSGLIALALSFHLIFSTVRLELDHSNGDAVWFIHNPTAPTDWISDTWSLGILIERQRRFCQEFGARQVYVVTLENAPMSTFSSIYGAPVQSGAKRSGIRLVDGIWNARLRTADPALHLTLKKLAQNVEVKAFQAAPFAYLVRTQLAQAMPEGKFSAGEVADRLGLPLRTFQRRLNEEQISFKDLLDAYRHDLALKMLARPNTTMNEIAYTLGYNEQSSFNRAFKRWTGETPRAWLMKRNTV